MQEAAIPTFSGFVGNSNVEHAIARWKGEELQYHTYGVPMRFNIGDSCHIPTGTCFIAGTGGLVYPQQVRTMLWTNI